MALTRCDIVAHWSKADPRKETARDECKRRLGKVTREQARKKGRKKDKTKLQQRSNKDGAAINQRIRSAHREKADKEPL